MNPKAKIGQFTFIATVTAKNYVEIEITSTQQGRGEEFTNLTGCSFTYVNNEFPLSTVRLGVPGIDRLAVVFEPTGDKISITDGEYAGLLKDDDPDLVPEVLCIVSKEDFDKVVAELTARKATEAAQRAAVFTQKKPSRRPAKTQQPSWDRGEKEQEDLGEYKVQFTRGGKSFRFIGTLREIVRLAAEKISGNPRSSLMEGDVQWFQKTNNRWTPTLIPGHLPETPGCLLVALGR